MNTRQLGAGWGGGAGCSRRFLIGSFLVLTCLAAYRRASDVPANEGKGTVPVPHFRNVAKGFRSKSATNYIPPSKLQVFEDFFENWVPRLLLCLLKCTFQVIRSYIRNQ
jgi:hypothetical protein